MTHSLTKASCAACVWWRGAGSGRRLEIKVSSSRDKWDSRTHLAVSNGCVAVLSSQGSLSPRQVSLV